MSSPGLVLAGFTPRFLGGRLYVLGETEIAYLGSLQELGRRQALETLFSYQFPCLFVTKGLAVPPEVLDLAATHDVAVIRTSLKTAAFYQRMRPFLEDSFAPHTVIHGSLADVYGVGLLFVGRSGIGKSECVLDLVERGHRLVADDLVEVRRLGHDVLIGRGHEYARHHMEIRGVGPPTNARGSTARRRRSSTPRCPKSWCRSTPARTSPSSPRSWRCATCCGSAGWTRRRTSTSVSSRRCNSSGRSASTSSRTMSELLRGVVLAHADLAAALVGAAQAIAGDDTGLTPVSNAGCDRAAIAARLETAVGAGPALIFTDLAGGSCTTVAATVARDRPELRVVAGANLAMLLEFAFHRAEPLEAVAERVAAAGRAAVREVGR
jgi:mannose/fructose-specific phosphotransferase system component IIA